jgi:post-segregation antitoxin (ccd killing protein)
MTDKRTPPRNFRPWPSNQERLALAERLGLNVSELINEVLDTNIARHLEEKARRIREAIAPARK